MAKGQLRGQQGSQEAEKGEAQDHRRRGADGEDRHGREEEVARSTLRRISGNITEVVPFVHPAAAPAPPRAPCRRAPTPGLAKVGVRPPRASPRSTYGNPQPRHGSVRQHEPSHAAVRRRRRPATDRPSTSVGLVGQRANTAALDRTPHRGKITAPGPSFRGESEARARNPRQRRCPEEAAALLPGEHVVLVSGARLRRPGKTGDEIQPRPRTRADGNARRRFGASPGGPGLRAVHTALAALEPAARRLRRWPAARNDLLSRAALWDVDWDKEIAFCCGITATF